MRGGDEEDKLGVSGELRRYFAESDMDSGLVSDGNSSRMSSSFKAIRKCNQSNSIAPSLRRELAVMLGLDL